MNPSNAALLAAATLFGLFVLAQSDMARASAISLRGRHGKHPVPAFAAASPNCATATTTTTTTTGPSPAQVQP